MVRRELAQRMPGGRDHLRADDIARRRPDGRAMREQRRLRVVGERQLVGRTLETEFAERRTERRVRALEDVFGARKRLDEILAHSGLLRALARKKENDIHGQSFTTIEPHVKPAPNATSSTFAPSPTTPFWMASSNAIGTDAADVLPKR